MSGGMEELLREERVSDLSRSWYRIEPCDAETAVGALRGAGVTVGRTDKPKNAVVFLISWAWDLDDIAAPRWFETEAEARRWVAERDRKRKRASRE